MKIHEIFVLTESGSVHGKPAYKKENGTYLHAGQSSYASGAPGNSMSQRPSSYR